MKNPLIVSLCVASLLLAGCGPKNESAAASAAVANAASGPVEFTANDTMKFNMTRFEVKAGQEVTVAHQEHGALTLPAPVPSCATRDGAKHNATDASASTVGRLCQAARRSDQPSRQSC